MVLSLPACTVNLETGQVRRTGGDLRLTGRELAFVRYLAARPGRTIERAELLREVWGYRDAVHSRTTDGTARRIREKIEADPSAPAVIVSVHGSGYRFVPLGPEADEADSPPPTFPRRRFRLGNRRVDLDRAVVEAPDGVHELTNNELALLEALWDAGGRTVDRDTLARRVWGTAPGRALPNALHRLRRKLEDDPSAPRHLVGQASKLRLELFPPPVLPPGVSSGPEALLRVTDPSFGHGATRDALAQAVSRARVVVVTGPAGVGKTRLVLEALADRPAALVEVGRAGGCDLDTRVAEALGLRADRDVAARIRDRLEAETWVVLDHAQDQLEAVAAWWSRFASTAARLVVTSRLPLRIPRAHRVEVGPLEPPDVAALFEDRVRRPLDPDERSAVGVLVAALDHLPFAVEVAASRAGVLRVPDLLSRLQEVLRTTGPDVLGHDRSVLASLDSVVGALPAAAVDLYHALAVCAGPVDLAAVEALVDRPDAIDLLGALIEARLVTRTPAGFVLPALARAHALRGVADSGALTSRHARVFAARAARAPELVPCVEEYAIAAIRTAGTEPRVAIPCALAALDGFTHTASVERAASLVDALAVELPPGWVGLLRSRVASARGELAEAHRLVSACPADDPELAIRAAILREDLARLGVGEVSVDALSALVEASADPELRALGRLALAATRRDVSALVDAGRDLLRLASPHEQLKAAELVANRLRQWHALREAAAWLELWSAAAVRHRSLRSEARAHVFAAWLANAGALSVPPVERLERALEVQRRIGDRSGESQTLFELGASLRAAGDAEGAALRFHEALALARRLPLPKAIAVLHWNLCLAMRDLGEREAAWDHAQVAHGVAVGTHQIELVRTIERDTLVAWIEDGEAARAAARARALLEAPVDAWDSAMLTLRLAEAEAALGSPAAAALAVDAASRFEALNNPRFVAHALSIARANVGS